MKNNKSKFEVPLNIVLFLLIVFIISKQLYFVYIALGIGIISMLSDKFAKVVTAVWEKIMAAFGFVNSHILLSLIFFVVLTPISFIFRMAKGDILGLKKKSNTYYKDRNHTYKAEDLDKMW